jgi:hypothetical protein
MTVTNLQISEQRGILLTADNKRLYRKDMHTGSVSADVT